jgi:hypothetical protein
MDHPYSPTLTVGLAPCAKQEPIVSLHGYLRPVQNSLLICARQPTSNEQKSGRRAIVDRMSVPKCPLELLWIIGDAFTAPLSPYWVVRTVCPWTRETSWVKGLPDEGPRRGLFASGRSAGLRHVIPGRVACGGQPHRDRGDLCAGHPHWTGTNRCDSLPGRVLGRAGGVLAGLRASRQGRDHATSRERDDNYRFTHRTPLPSKMQKMRLPHCFGRSPNGRSIPESWTATSPRKPHNSSASACSVCSISCDVPGRAIAKRHPRASRKCDRALNASLPTCP